MSGLAHWDPATKFTGREAAALAVGIDPTSTVAEGMAKSSPMLDRMKGSYNAKKRWYEDDGQPQCDEPEVLPTKQMLESFEMHWLATTEPYDSGNFYEWLRNERRSGFESQHFARNEIARWLSEIGVQSVYSFRALEPESASEKPLGTKERERLLTIVIGMAVEGYKFKPSAGKSPTAKEIADDVAKLGLHVSDDTVRKYLKEAASLLAVKTLKY